MRADATPVALFARAPSLGRAKTRLAPALGVEGAAALYDAFLRDVIASIAATPELEPRVWAASREDAEALAEAVAPLSVQPQPAGDLGVRIRAALDDGARRAGRAIVLGTDAPTLPPRLLRHAAEALRHDDVVLGPTADGGYYLVGVRERAFELDGVRWSSPHALSDTLARAHAGGRTVHLLAPWYDVDTPDDLRLLRAHLRLRPHVAPCTAHALGLKAPAFDRRPKP